MFYSTRMVWFGLGLNRTKPNRTKPIIQYIFIYKYIYTCILTYCKFQLKFGFPFFLNFHIFSKNFKYDSNKTIIYIYIYLILIPKEQIVLKTKPKNYKHLRSRLVSFIFSGFHCLKVKLCNKVIIGSLKTKRQMQIVFQLIGFGMFTSLC